MAIFTDFLSLVLQPSDSPAAVRAALDLVLRRKAIAAEALATQRDAVLGGKYPALEPKLRELGRPADADRPQDAGGAWTRRSRVSPATTRRVECPERAAGRRNWPGRSPR